MKLLVACLLSITLPASLSSQLKGQGHDHNNLSALEWTYIPYEHVRIHNPEDVFLTLDFVNDSMGMAVCSDASMLELLMTSDCGNSWESVYDEVVALDDDPPSPFYISDGAWPVDTTLFLLYKEGVIKRSHDYGETFSNIDISSEFPVNSIGMLDGRTGLVFGSAELFVTHDGWQTYQRIPFLEIQETGLLHAVALENRIVAFKGSDSQLQTSVFVSSNDDGLTWNSGAELPLTVSDIYFLDSDNGWLCGYRNSGIGDTKYDIVFATSDGGETWVEQLYETENILFGLRSISFSDESNGLAVGPSSRIYRTYDGGQNWELQKIVDPERQLVVDYSFTSIAAWSGERPFVGTYGAGLFAYEDPQNVLSSPVLIKPYDGESGLDDVVQLTWDKQPGFGIRTQVQISQSIDFASTVIDTLVAGNNLSVGASLEANVFYYWRARTTKGTEGKELKSLWSRAFSFASGVGVPILQIPVNGALNVETPTTLKWTSVPGAETYDLQCSYDSTFTDLLISESSVTNAYTLKDVSTYQHILWRVRARDQSGVGPWSNISFYRTKMETPLFVSPHCGESVGHAQSVSYAWDAVIGADVYVLQYSVDSNFVSGVESIATADTHFILNTVPNDTSLYAKVKATKVDGSEQSDFSNFCVLDTRIPTSVQSSQDNFMTWTHGHTLHIGLEGDDSYDVKVYDSRGSILAQSRKNSKHVKLDLRVRRGPVLCTVTNNRTQATKAVKVFISH